MAAICTPSNTRGNRLSSLLFVKGILVRYLSVLMLAGLGLYWSMPMMLAAAYAIASLACFAMYAIDKRAAIARAPRTRERSLLLAGLACGWPGAALAQQWLRHKSSKASFQAWFWLTVALNFGALAAWRLL